MLLSISAGRSFGTASSAGVSCSFSITYGARLDCAGGGAGSRAALLRPPTMAGESGARTSASVGAWAGERSLAPGGLVASSISRGVVCWWCWYFLAFAVLSSPLQPRSSLSPSPSDFPSKLRAAFEVFFPPASREGELSDARGEAKRRLRMVLVADRSAMTEDTLQRMKDSIVEAVSAYVEIDGGAPQVQVQWNQDAELGTIYSVSVPVVRVLSQVSRIGKGEWKRWVELFFKNQYRLVVPWPKSSSTSKQGGAGGGAQTLNTKEKIIYDSLEQKMLDDRTQ